eukprot:6643918-Alexandrium_andersonii.AAC.1
MQPQSFLQPRVATHGPARSNERSAHTQSKFTSNRLEYEALELCVFMSGGPNPESPERRQLPIDGGPIGTWDAP